MNLEQVVVTAIQVEISFVVLLLTVKFGLRGATRPQRAKLHLSRCGVRGREDVWRSCGGPATQYIHQGVAVHRMAQGIV